MLTIRLSRTGKKKQPTFRFILAEKSKDPWGRYLENLGFYNPRSKELQLNADRIKYWLEKGAQPSDTVWNHLVDKGLVEGKKHGVTKMSKKRAAKMAEAKKADEAAKELAKATPTPTPESEPVAPVEEPQA